MTGHDLAPLAVAQAAAVRVVELPHIGDKARRGAMK
jgi:hypothetical protein